jgi:hypothetical protein
MEYSTSMSDIWNTDQKQIASACGWEAGCLYPNVANSL